MSGPRPDEAFHLQVRDAFHALVEFPPEQRPARLGECDPAVRAEVESLLAQHETGSGFLARSIWQLIDEGEAQSLAGTEIGPYRITRALGSGGMGEVFLASRSGAEFTQRVAIKLVRGGRAGRAVIDRFRRERQILASLEHPNISRMLDGGTTADGLPYLVMEYVEGLPIDEYCRNRELPLEQRLGLFTQLCDAVQYAHRSLVVHRDIKPANVLVTEDGIPKLLDFGIAKLTAGETVPEMPATRLMTPDYASPEQLAGGVVTTASDIYSLGALLFELLAGRRPFEGRVRNPEDEPPLPSASSGLRSLRGDLDWIVLKAMEADPNMRYGSAEALADDVRRYLAGHPVSARPGTAVYRLQKFVRRNRMAVGAAILLVLVTAGGFVTTLRQKRIAERRFDEVRALAKSVVFEIHDAIESLPGSTPARELLVRRALSYLDTLAAEAEENPGLQMELVGAYQRIGDVQGLPYRANLGDSNGALQSYRKAIAIAEAARTRRPDDAELLSLLADLHDRAGVVELRALRMSAALREHEAARVIRERLGTGEIRNALALARTWVGIADALYISPSDLRPEERTMAPREAYHNALRILEQVGDAGAARRDLLNELGRVHQRLGGYYSGQQDLDLERAIRHHDAALRALEERARVDPSDNVARRNYADQIVMKATAQNTMRDGEGALAGTTEALSILTSISEEDPENVEAQHDLAFAHEQMANALMHLRRWDEAETAFEEALTIRRRLIEKDPGNIEGRRGILVIYTAMSEMQRLRGNERLSLWYREEAARMARGLQTGSS